VNAKAKTVNLITFARLPLIFVWLALAVARDTTGSTACAVFALAAIAAIGLSDMFDGYFARKWHVVSQFGKMADPLMDKLFYAVSLPALAYFAARRGDGSAHALMLLLFAVLYIVRDLWVTFMRSLGAAQGAEVAAMMLGKVRTALTFPAVGFIYLYLVFSHALSPALSKAALVACFATEAGMTALNVVSFVSYTRAYMPYIKKTANVS